MPKFPTDAADIPTYFEGLEKLYSSFEVPSSLQAKLLLPYLSGKAKSLLLRLEQSKQGVYIEVKSSCSMNSNSRRSCSKENSNEHVRNNDEHSPCIVLA